MPFEASDDELMERVQKGDRAAYAALLKRHGSAVYGATMRLLSGNRAKADDITQEVWLKVLEKCHLYKPNGHFRAWLMTVARNQALMELRRNTRFSDSEESLEEAPDVSFDVEAALDDEQVKGKVKALIDGLPDAQRAALVLWLGGEVSYEEIAAEMGLTLGAVKTHIHRAKASLKAKLEAA